MRRTFNRCRAHTKPQIATGHKLEELPKEDHKWLSDDYKREVLEKMSVSQLVDTVRGGPCLMVLAVS